MGKHLLSCQSRYFYQLRTWGSSFVRKRETPGTSYSSIHSEWDVMPMPVIDCNAFSMKRPSVQHLFSWINNLFFNEEHMESYFSTWIRKLFFRVRSISQMLFSPWIGGLFLQAVWWNCLSSCGAHSESSFFLMDRMNIFWLGTYEVNDSK